MKKIVVYTFCMMYGLGLMSQNEIDLKISPQEAKNDMSCYDVSVRTAQKNPILLAGQNYRLFYDAEKLDFVKGSSGSILDPRSYGKMDMVNTETRGIGFLSLSMGARKLTDKTIRLNSPSEWTKTAYICFTRQTITDFDLTWAHNRRTEAYATAEVAMSEWLDKDHHQVLNVNLLEDFSSVEDVKATDQSISVQVFPNPMLDYVNIELDHTGREGELLIIKDVIGREVVYDNILGKQNLSYDLVNWPDGTYTVDILNSEAQRIYSQKVIKVSR